MSQGYFASLFARSVFIIWRRSGTLTGLCVMFTYEFAFPQISGEDVMLRKR